MGLRPLSEEDRQNARAARRRQKLSETQKLYARDFKYDTGVFDRSALEALQIEQDKERAARYQYAQHGRARVEAGLVAKGRVLTPLEQKEKMAQMLADCRKSRTILRGSFYKKGNQLITLIGRTLSSETHDIWWLITMAMVGVVVLLTFAGVLLMVTFVLELNK